MATALLAGRLHPAGLALLESRSDVTVEMLDNPSSADITARIASVDGLILRTTPLGADAIARADRLKVVSRHGVGYDNVDLAALNARGIPLTVVGSVNAVTVAEHALAMMLAVTRRILPYDRGVRSGNYAIRDTLAMVELAGKTVLIVGFGRIGTRVARRCTAFDMTVVVADPYVPRRVVEGFGYGYVADFREALHDADIITLHLPGNADRSPVFGRDEIDRTKPGAYLINCARGTLVDERALVAALGSGRLAGAGLDVTRDEPPDPHHPLLALENVVLSPHSAGSTGECFARMATVAAQNLLDAFDGRLDPDLVVNPEVFA